MKRKFNEVLALPKDFCKPKKLAHKALPGNAELLEEAKLLVYFAEQAQEEYDASAGAGSAAPTRVSTPVPGLGNQMKDPKVLKKDLKEVPKAKIYPTIPEYSVRPRSLSEGGTPENDASRFAKELEKSLETPKTVDDLDLPQLKKDIKEGFRKAFMPIKKP